MIKTFPAELSVVLRSRRGRRNLRVLSRFFIVLAVMISIYTVVFHMLMLREGQEHTWATGFYWTLTVMSTLGFGDITFHTDIGRLFSIVVLLSGMIFLLVLLPFTFIEFFYEPWMNARAAARAPRQLPPDTHGHVLLTRHDEVTSALIRRLEQYSYSYALMVPNVEDALRLHDQELKVMVGHLDDPEAWKRARVQSAALVASTAGDVTNTNVAFTVRELAKDVPIITSVREEASVDILSLAGSDHVLQFEQMIGQSFSVRTLGGDARAHVIGQFDELMIAEAAAHRTPLVGKTLLESALREETGVTVVGVWERGHFELARSETVIRDKTVLVLAGSEEHLSRYNELFRHYSTSAAPVVILGGGGVGRATAAALKSRGVDYRIVEVDPTLILDPQKYVHGNAADLEVLEQAGIHETATVIVTTNVDDLNVYLTIYCRQLRPEIQILSRATYERNVPTLHRAGADIVLSYASMAAGAVMNLLRRGRILMVAEGLNLFKVRMPASLAGKTIAQSTIREDTGCSVVAMETESGTEVVPNPMETMPADAEILLIGTADSEERFLELYGPGKSA
jgi:Trk K+ transport system NAD-binding subunit